MSDSNDLYDEFYWLGLSWNKKKFIKFLRESGSKLKANLTAQVDGATVEFDVGTPYEPGSLVVLLDGSNHQR